MTSASLDPEARKLLKRYYRYVLSYKDFKHARLCASHLAGYGDTSSPETHAIEEALYCSMVVAYSRPFNSAGTSKIGKIPSLENEVRAQLTEEEFELHEYVLLCRNKLIAHTDAEYLDLDPYIADDLPDNLVIPLVNDALAPFTQAYTLKFEKLCEKLVTWVVETRAEIEPLVLPYLRSSNFIEKPSSAN